MKKQGGYIPGIRPGEQTARFIDKVMTRLTLSGSLYMVLVCLVPQMLMNWFNVQFYFGGTSLLKFNFNLYYFYRCSWSLYRCSNSDFL